MLVLRPRLQLADQSRLDRGVNKRAAETVADRHHRHRMRLRVRVVFVVEVLVVLVELLEQLTTALVPDVVRRVLTLVKRKGRNETRSSASFL